LPHAAGKINAPLKVYRKLALKAQTALLPTSDRLAA
jgi:hypothetical protein